MRGVIKKMEVSKAKTVDYSCPKKELMNQWIKNTQGMEKKLPKEILKIIQNELKDVEITRESIRKVLKEKNLIKEHLDDISRIYHELTGK